jgi:hypothetical protein
MNGNPHLLKPRKTRTMKNSAIAIMGKTNGRASSEHRITWVTMLTAIFAIAAQVAGKLWLGIDLEINIDLALATGFGSGAAYTIARMAVKTGIAFAEGKVHAAKADAGPKVVKARLAGDSSAEPVPTTVLPPTRSPLEMRSPQEETKVW